MKIATARIIKNLAPDLELSVKGEPKNEAEYLASVTVHKGGVMPTWAQVVAEKNRLQAEHNGKDFERKRRGEYPSNEEQLEAIWAGGTEFDKMKARIQAIQTKHPKP